MSNAPEGDEAATHRSGFENPKRIRTDCDSRNAYTVYHHTNCGKEWQEQPDDHLPNYCPGCGGSL